MNLCGPFFAASLNVQLLDPLPLRVLQDFNREPYEPLALRPEDNANEFRRLYDDNYRGPISLLVLEKGTKKGGKKRVPPTKPYLHMLVLYDMLKREAKKNMYSIYEVRGVGSHVNAPYSVVNCHIFHSFA